MAPIPPAPPAAYGAPPRLEVHGGSAAWGAVAHGGAGGDDDEDDDGIDAAALEALKRYRVGDGWGAGS